VAVRKGRNVPSGTKQTKRAKRPDPVDFSDAEQALRMGGEQGAAVAVNALAETLNLVADLLEPKKGKNKKPRLGFTPAQVQAPAPGPLAETYTKSRLDQAKNALRDQSAVLLGRYFRHGAEFLTQLGAALDPASSSKDWRLEFRRKGRGRRPGQSGGLLAYEVLVLVHGDGWKQEAAIEDVKTRYGVSRATVMRALKKKAPESLRIKKNS
jgi:hypothetical protein